MLISKKIPSGIGYTYILHEIFGSCGYEVPMLDGCQIYPEKCQSNPYQMKYFALLFFFFSLMVSHQSTAQNVRVNMIAGSEAAQVQTYPGPDRTSDWNISHVNDGTFTIHNHSITINNVYGFVFGPII